MADFPPLVAGETVLWDGKPDTKLRFGMETMATGIFAVTLILACLGMATVIERSMPGNYWTILGPGLILGIVIALVFPVRDSRKRGRTAYRLTNKRAIIRVGDTSHIYAIPAHDQIILRGEDPKTVTLGRHANNRPLSFERIADGDAVYALLQGLATQDEAA